MTETTSFGSRAAELLTRIRQKNPLIHHITNFVVMNDTANLTLAFGASPVMAHAIEEVAELTSVAGALILNPGTLTTDWVQSMLVAGKKANELGVPVIYDPVGVGATQLRNQTAALFLRSLKLAVIRGNAGEIGALAGAGGAVKGVDSVGELNDPAQVARNLAQKYNTVVAITGKRDILSDGRRVWGVDNGHPLLKTITGSGCMATTAVATFCAVEKDALLAAALGLACYELAAEKAALTAKGPGSFRSALLDEVYALTPEAVEIGVKIVEL